MTPAFGFEPDYYSSSRIEGKTDFRKNPLVGDTFSLITILDSSDRNQAADKVMYITQILEEDGVTESIQISYSNITSDDVEIKLENIWTPPSDGFKTIEIFVWSERQVSGDLQDGASSYLYPLTYKSGMYFYVKPKPPQQVHDFDLKIDLETPLNLVAGEDLKGSIFLIDNGSKPEYVKLDWAQSWIRPINTDWAPPPLSQECTYRYADKISDPLMVPADGGKIRINPYDTILAGWQYEHADTYWFSLYALLSVEQEDGTVGCIYLLSNAITLNVTAKPIEGITLALSTDKEVYNQGEPVKFDVRIVNSRTIPFEVHLENLYFHFHDSNGKKFLQFNDGYPVDWSPVSIPPNSSLDLLSERTSDYIHETGLPLSWNQRLYSSSESYQAPPGGVSYLCNIHGSIHEIQCYMDNDPIVCYRIFSGLE